MSHPFRIGLRCLVPAFAMLCCLIVTAEAQEKELKKLRWSHAFDLAARPYGKDKFDKSTPRWGVEAFRDDNTGVGLYISQTGSLAITPNFKGVALPIDPSKGPAHQTGLDLPARRAGELKFMKGTKVHSMEAFRDPNVDNWLFITEQGFIAATDGTKFPGAANREPKWAHSVDLQARKGGVKDFKDSPKFGIEVYKDGNTGNLIYITEHGHVAIIPETKEVKGEGKSPDWLHGLDLFCRRNDEKSFTKDTKLWGIEIYHDVHTGNLLFISETGSIGVAPARAGIKAPTPPDVKKPRWTHGLNVKCRPHGKNNFDDAIPFGAEVFVDENLDVLIYINEKGYIAVMSAK